MSDQGEGRGSVWVAGAVVAGLVLFIGVPVGLFTATAVMMSMVFSQQQARVGDCGGGEGGVVYASDGPMRLPVVGSFTYTSPFGMRLHPIYGVMRLHAGIDLVSNGDIVAPKAGTVSSVIHGDPGAGNFVVVDHGGGISTRYLHLASITVRVGQKLQPGQKIGVEGTTGGSTGVHLHFEVRENNNPTDPAAWLRKNGVSLPALGGTGVAPGAGQKDPNNDVEVVAAVAENQVGAGQAFDLPAAGPERKNSTHTKAMPIPADLKKLYVAAGAKYGLPWELLAGIGMEETHHWRIKAVSAAGAMGPMQFTPPTWIDYGVDGNGDGKREILDPADAIYSAANMLAQNGATDSPEGVKRAIRRYNNATWYVNDVLHYAHAYGNGTVSVSASGDDCGAIDVSMASNQTAECPATSSPAEKGLQPSALNVLRCGSKTAPWVRTMYGLGERAGATDHDDGLAVDFMVPDYKTSASNARGWELARWLQRNARRLNITYVIFDQKIWTLSKDSQGWRPMQDRGSDTENHRDHVHVSVAP